MTFRSSPPNRHRRRIVVTIAVLVLVVMEMAIVLIRNERSDLRAAAPLLFSVWLVSAVTALFLNAVDYVAVLLLAQVMLVLLGVLTADHRDPDWFVLLGINCVGSIVGILSGLGFAAYRRLGREPLR